MSDNKDNKSIPLVIAEATGIVAGAIVGNEAGESVAGHIADKLDLSETAAEHLDAGAGIVGAGLAAYAGLRYAQKSPDKAFLTAAKVIAGAGAVIGADAIMEGIEKLDHNVQALHADVQELAHQREDNPEHSASAFNETAQPDLLASTEDAAWQDIHGNWSDRDPLTGERPHDIFDNQNDHDSLGNPSYHSIGDPLEHHVPDGHDHDL